MRTIQKAAIKGIADKHFMLAIAPGPFGYVLVYSVYVSTPRFVSTWHG
jgi:hypothetical protein